MKRTGSTKGRNDKSIQPADRRRRRPAALLGRCAGRRHVFALSGAVFGWLGGYHDIKSKEALMTRNQKRQSRRERLLLLAAVILLAVLLAVVLR